MDVWLLLLIVYCDVSLDGFGFWSAGWLDGCRCGRLMVA